MSSSPSKRPCKTLSNHIMSAEFGSYRETVRKCAAKWPELEWIHRFLQTPKPADANDTYAQTFDFIDSSVVESDVFRTPRLFSETLNNPLPGSSLRVVLVCHGDSWTVDRDIVDVACAKYDLDPRFVSQHFDYPYAKWEKNCPRDISKALAAVDDHYFENKYTWSLGGAIISSLSLQLSGHFCFAYKHECLSLKVLEEASGTTRKQSWLLNVVIADKVPKS